MARPKASAPRTGRAYADKPAPMPYSNLYHNWRSDISTGKGIAQAAAAHSERFLPYQPRWR